MFDETTVAEVSGDNFFLRLTRIEPPFPEARCFNWSVHVFAAPSVLRALAGERAGDLISVYSAGALEQALQFAYESIPYMQCQQLLALSARLELEALLRVLKWEMSR